MTTPDDGYAPPICQARDCTEASITVFTDGAGRALSLCEEHGDLLAVGFPLKAHSPQGSAPS